MAKSNFRVFAEGVAENNIESDNEYETDTQRVSGVVPGIAVPKMHNKLYKQSTVMAAALAQVIVQAGLDALDSDYSGLVSNLRKTFAGSVNGLKPDDKGNIDISSLLQGIRDMIPPRVGDAIVTLNSENPSNRYPGTTWELLPEKTFIMSAGNTAKVGETGGNNSHSQSVEEIAAHVHGYSMGTAGGHNHTRGNMNITGTLPLPTHTGRWDRFVTGAFWAEGGNGGSVSRRVQGCDFPESGQWWDVTYGTFDASKTWTGYTSYVSPHVHTLQIQSAGSGKAWDTRPQYKAFYIWVRTA